MKQKLELVKAALLLSVLIAGSPAIAASGTHEHDSYGHRDMMQKGQVETRAVINSVNEGARKINASHEPISEISWPAMTMDFDVLAHIDLSGIEAGSAVTLVLAPSEHGAYKVHDITSEQHSH